MHRRYLTNEEVFRFARAVPDEKRSVLVLTLAYTGIRCGEAVALTVNDIDLHRCRLAIHQTATEVDGLFHVGPPKSWEARSAPFPAFLAPRLEALVEGKKAGDLVFLARAGSYLARPDNAWNRQS